MEPNELTKQLFEIGIAIIPEEFYLFKINSYDTVETAIVKVENFKTQHLICLCGEFFKNHENAETNNYHALGGCEKSGCARFTMKGKNI